MALYVHRAFALQGHSARWQGHVLLKWRRRHLQPCPLPASRARIGLRLRIRPGRSLQGALHVRIHRGRVAKIGAQVAHEQIGCLAVHVRQLKQHVCVINARAGL